MIYKIENGTVECSCIKIVRRGFLCRHVFCVFKNRNIEYIPKQYVLRRWMKNLIPAELKRKRVTETSVYDKLSNEATTTFDECMKLIGNNEEKLGDFVHTLKKIKTDIETSTSEVEPANKTDIIEKLHGVAKPTVVEIQNPDVLRYKGCGRDKRLKSSKEKAIESKKKCRKCGEAGHNRQTCDKKKAEAKKQAEEKERETEYAQQGGQDVN